MCCWRKRWNMDKSFVFAPGVEQVSSSARCPEDLEPQQSADRSQIGLGDSGHPHVHFPSRNNALVRASPNNRREMHSKLMLKDVSVEM